MTSPEKSEGKKQGLLFSRNKSNKQEHEDTAKENTQLTNWKVMVIDDEEAVHQVTHMVLEDLTFKDKGLTIIDGYSGKDARRLLVEHPDTAVLLLDVVMETNKAGLELVKFIREEIHNYHVRIILRTGQPGDVPEKKVITQYDINDYKAKADLTADKLYTTMVAALRAYNDLKVIEDLALSRSNLEEKVEERTKEIMQINKTLEAEIQQRIRMNEQLRKSESRLAHAQLIANIGHWEWKITEDEVTWSDQIFRILGEEPSESAPRFDSMLSHVPKDERENITQLFNQIIHSKNHHYEFEHSIYRHDGTPRFVLQQGEITRDDSGQATKLSGILQDITERKIAEERMRQLSGAIQQIADSVMITDLNGKIEYVNSAFEQMTGYSQREVIGKTPRILKSDKQSQSFYKRMWNTILRGEVFTDVVINTKKNGEFYYEEKTITPQRNAEEKITHYISTGKDITERMEAQERLHYLAHHDALTGLPNRALLQDRLNQMIASAQWHPKNAAVLFMDLDRFKIINDSLGHNVGDTILQTMAERLTLCIHPGDTVSRLGGDEFAIVLNDVESVEEVREVALKLLKSISEPIVFDNKELFVTSSIGISLFPKDSEDTLGLLKKADVAMYRAKNIGRNSYQMYSKKDDRNTAEKLSLESSLRRALEREEFFLNYQPQYKGKDRKIYGAEALIRWHSNQFSSVSPAHFIPLLEETGMIIPVSEWVLKTACQQAKQWQDMSNHENFRVAINLSICQFKRPGLVKLLENVLSETGVKPDNIELEVTEGLLIENIAQTKSVLHELHELGVHLAIDDFGTGYSSMNYLRRLPFDHLKIDKSFIQDITLNEDGAAITNAIISLAHSLGMKVIAEGVETNEQLDYLVTRNCDIVQGFLLSKPIESNEINKLLTH
ncbi:EAL domain-containing protein [Paraneptunicella aestuarii]|uniref:EAL domain-containing protein n=1 Tax=Paraneptunicella aestuarii TaxID=2831148 RepID=UPI001E3A21F0|nr:EAL domain-containing protein [Paraneptunicella aestuarii]UAA39007.1 EAL domain-containing protein [Paraneptunicella aestuarii]